MGARPHTMSSPSAPLAEAILAVLRAISATLRPRPPNAAPPAATLLAEVPSPAAMRLLREHLLGPMAARAGVAAFRHDAIANALLWDVRRALWRDVVADLSRHGIAAAPIKGMAYALDLYDDPALRPMSDIDVLVPAAAFDAACAVLLGKGFVHSGGAHQRATSHHAMTFKRLAGSAGVALAVDLHRHIVHADRTALDPEAWWARARDGGVDGWRLAPLDALLLHIAHMARHEFRVPLVNLVDGAMLLWRWQAEAALAGTSPPTWDDLRAAAKRARMARMYEVWRYITESALALVDTAELPHRSRLATYCTPDLASLAVAHRPTRVRQVGQKLALCQGPSEAIALAVSAAKSARSGWRAWSRPRDGGVT